MDRYSAAIALFLMVLPAFAAEDHLAPEDSIIGGTEYTASHDDKIRSLLKDAYAPRVMVRMVTNCDSVCSLSYPGPGPFAVALEPSGRLPPYKVFALRISAVPVLDDPHIARAETSVETVSRCEADISQSLGDRIVAVWREMVLRTRYPGESGQVLDGQSYHFWAASGAMAGQVWNPDQDSATGNLVALAYMMGKYCVKEPGAGEAELSKATAELEARLKRQP